MNIAVPLNVGSMNNFIQIPNMINQGSSGIFKSQKLAA